MFADYLKERSILAVFSFYLFLEVRQSINVIAEFMSYKFVVQDVKNVPKNLLALAVGIKQNMSVNAIVKKVVI